MIMLVKRFERELFASHFQFYLHNENSDCDTGRLWNKKSVYERMLALCKDFIAVGTGRFETVPASLEIHDAEPPLETDNYSRVNECSLITNSGKLILIGCLEDVETAMQIEVEPGIYRIRIIYGNLETVVDEIDGEDYYILQMWQDSSYKDVEILKAEQPFFRQN